MGRLQIVLSKQCGRSVGRCFKLAGALWSCEKDRWRLQQVLSNVEVREWTRAIDIEVTVQSLPRSIVGNANMQERSPGVDEAEWGLSLGIPPMT